MSPERVADLVARWVRLYTRGLPGPVAVRRREELAADVHDHIAHFRATGVTDWHIAFGLASRTLRGVPADAMWRRRALQAAPRRLSNTSPSLVRSAIRVVLGVVLVLAVPLAATLNSDGEGWGLGDFVLAGVLLATLGVTVELALRRAGTVVLALTVAALGVAAGLLGEADDAPGLVLLGLLLVAGGGAIGLRRATR